MDTMPIVDLGALLDKSLESLGNAIKDGFTGEFRSVVLINHGLIPGILRDKKSADRKLFSLPNILDYRADSIDCSGYFPEGKEYASSSRAPDRKRMWHAVRELDVEHPLYRAHPRNKWPEEIPEFREATVAAFEALDFFADIILLSLEAALGFDEPFLMSRAKDGKSVLRSNFYPSDEKLVRGDYGEWRNGAHTDINLITVMPAPVEKGLQVRLGESGWCEMDAPVGSLIVVVGKMLAALTNGYLRPTWHRVANTEPAYSRYSLPFFKHPHPGAVIEPHRRFVVPGTRASLPRMTAEQFRDAVKTPGMLRDWVVSLG